MRRLLRRLRSHRFGISAPRLTVRPHVAWYWRALGLVAMASVSVAAGMWIYDEGRRFAGYDASQITLELDALRERSARLDQETAKLRTIASISESSLQIERTALEKLSQQVKLLEAENSRLREDLAFFDSLLGEGAYRGSRRRVSLQGAERRGPRRVPLPAPGDAGRAERNESSPGACSSS